jgi:hypothetical protein
MVDLGSFIYFSNRALQSVNDIYDRLGRACLIANDETAKVATSDQSHLIRKNSSSSQGAYPSAYDLVVVRGGALESVSGGWRRTFLRLSFCASLLLRRFFSPGFRKNECFLTSLIMPSC